VASGLSVFVNAETNTHIEIRVENFQLEQLLSEITQLNSIPSLSLSLSLSAIQPALCSPHVEFSRFHIAVATYCLPLLVAQEPYKASLGHDKSAI
jgi:hypothetical protein